ncbi:MAG: hypothetical protein LH650_04815 [Chloroflexi bacterium]|nr:hypothetical protein [Chloroflexota bacterium]
MNVDRSFERRVTTAYAEVAPTREPDGLFLSIVSTTSRTRPRPRWLALMKEPPMRMHSRVAAGSPTFRLVTIFALNLALVPALAGAVVAGASLLPTTPLPEPFGPARNGSLVFAKGGDIWIASADGSDPKAIITGPEREFSAWFSHHGTRMAFGRGPEAGHAVMTANADGTDVRELLPVGG